MFNKLLRRQKEKLEEQINLIEKSIKEHEHHLANINSQVEQSKQTLNKVQDNLFESKRRLVDIQQEIDFSNGVVTIQELGLEYKPVNHILDEISFKKSNIQAEIAKLLGYEQSLAKALNEQERQEFEAKLKEIDKREADVDYRINNSKAGYLYIAATKAMPDCCKLGVTRRLNPLVRLSELSSASVPFPFKCYGLVFSDDAFDLETRIHEYFDNKRVNTENKHKEFFYITPQEAIKVLKEKFGCDVHFVNEESEDEK